MRHDLKLIFRKIKNNKTFPVINIMGLTIGLSCSILAFLYIQDEFSYNEQFKYTENIYRLTGNNFGGTNFGSNQPARFIDNILQKNPEVTCGVRLNFNPSFIKVLDNSYTIENFLFADSNFFNFFNSELLVGNPDNVLDAPNKTVISESLAKELYGNKNPVGEKVKINNNWETTITGVFKDFPKQSDIKADLITSFITRINYNRNFANSWGWFSSDIYLKVKHNTDILNLNRKLGDLWDNDCINDGTLGENVTMLLQPFSDIHLRSGYLSNTSDNVLITYGIAALSIFILVIACFNFINLSIAIYSKRNIETGIKKVMGAGKIVFSRQVFIEVTLYFFLSLLLSLIIVYSIIKPFNAFLDKNLLFSIVNNHQLLIFILSISIVLVLGTGLYPLLNMIKTDTSGILKGATISSRKYFAGISFQSNIRNILVIVQFTFGIMLILSAIIVNKQLQLIRHKDSGFNKEQVMVIFNPLGTNEFYNQFTQSIQQLPEISIITCANNVPTDGIWNWGTPAFVGDENNGVNMCGYVSVDYEYFDAIGAEFIMGRNFIKDKESENEKLIITETLMKKLGVKNPLGKQLTNLWDGINREIIGVIKDIEFHTIHNERHPILFFCRNHNIGLYPKIIIKLKTNNLAQSIKKIEKEWKKTAPDWPINYFFLDEKFEANYQKEKQIATVINVLTWIAIFLCCIGLFGLALYNINGRIKEMGVRKVNGAKEREIMLLINKEFITWIIVAYIIAIPLSVGFMNKWLENFAYRTKIPWWALLSAGGIAFGIAMLTVSWQSWMAARRNPVETLRYE